MFASPLFALRRPLSTRWYSDEAAAPSDKESLVLPHPKVIFTLATPTETLLKRVEATGVLIPGTEGKFMIHPRIIPIISEVKAGVVEVNTGKEVLKYFVAGGFAFVHKDGTSSVSASEAVPVANLDSDAARQALTEAQAQMNAASNPFDKAIARINVETSEAVIAALK